MAVYPVSQVFEGYSGRDPGRRRRADEFNRLAARIAQHINDAMAAGPEHHIRPFIAHTVARELGEDPELVRRIISRMDGGYNGMTVRRGDARKALAAR